MWSFIGPARGMTLLPRDSGVEVACVRRCGVTQRLVPLTDGAPPSRQDLILPRCHLVDHTRTLAQPYAGGDGMGLVMI